MVLIPQVNNRVLSVLEGFAPDGLKLYVGDCPQAPFGAGGSGAGPGTLAPSPPAGLRQEGNLAGFASDGLKVYSNTDCSAPGFLFDTILSLLTGFWSDGKKVYAAGCCQPAGYGSGSGLGSGAGAGSGLLSGHGPSGALGQGVVATACCPGVLWPTVLHATCSGVTGSPSCTCFNGLVVPLTFVAGQPTPVWKSGTFPQFSYAACGFTGFLSLTCAPLVCANNCAGFQLVSINANFGGTSVCADYLGNSSVPCSCDPIFLQFDNSAVANPNCPNGTWTITL